MSIFPLRISVLKTSKRGPWRSKFESLGAQDPYSDGALVEGMGRLLCVEKVHFLIILVDLNFQVVFVLGRILVVLVDAGHTFCQASCSQHFVHILIIGGYPKVRVVVGRTEFVARHHKEHVGCHLAEHVIQPLVLEGYCHPQQIDNYPCKVNVADNHDVEVTEEFQFLEVDGSLSVALRGFLQVTNGPDYRQQDGSTAKEVQEEEQLHPHSVLLACLLRLLDYDRGNIGNDLEGDDNHEDLPLFAGENVLDEGPAGANESQNGEQQSALQQVHDIEHDSPGLHVDPSCLNEVVVDAMEEQAERLDDDQNAHQVVDLEDGILALLEEEEPEASREEEEEGHHEVESRQRHLTSRQVVVVRIHFLDLQSHVDL